jgi:lysophospholipase L1-like esterase
VKRFGDDVLSRPNVTHVIVLEGINDISYEHATAVQLIDAYQDLIARARAKGIRIIGATLLPIGRSVKDSPENEATRQRVNDWIRTAGHFDAVIDFEAVVRDPANPRVMRSDLTADFVHPNTEGYRLMAHAIDPGLFE